MESPVTMPQVQDPHTMRPIQGPSLHTMLPVEEQSPHTILQTEVKDHLTMLQAAIKDHQVVMESLLLLQLVGTVTQAHPLVNHMV